MDIFVEPVLPHPSLVILGVSPVALSLATQARQPPSSTAARTLIQRSIHHSRAAHTPPAES